MDALWYFRRLARCHRISFSLNSCADLSRWQLREKRQRKENQETRHRVFALPNVASRSSPTRSSAQHASWTLGICHLLHDIHVVRRDREVRLRDRHRQGEGLGATTLRSPAPHSQISAGTDVHAIPGHTLQTREEFVAR